MAREVRRVPADWKHPKRNGQYIPLLGGSYAKDAKLFLEKANSEGLQEAVEYFGCPDKNKYMPEWTEEQKTHFMMYENTTEGTPISPSFDTPEKLAQWLFQNKASVFADVTATYSDWLAIIKRGNVVIAMVPA